ncbi:DSBA-like thioredoxin domain-containing protein [Colletotrichum graminicola M1.001]|uniref:DSBA-like thioredoxin domain-containing protein n=1 Tax=Colletotrichum graminicola (strain M1.001 / M2 / FGSC 10212) TaxID=645133 RepID=E3QY75_COLGM|nr:DSBA-like thioredoxin domain-containing protein [Colletotrichum graminicola M1.001]EFQ35813.1 DSBA-like thioredoxin domain-containing protein [Colletotrichum graminicola M1.001]
MAVIKVEVVFDFVCAWCYIGKRKLDRAIALYQKTYPGGKNDVFAITWRPYYLDYNPSTHSVDKSLLAETKLADMSPERRAALTQRMEQTGRFVGIDFKWGGKIGPDTRDAHRLVRVGSAKGPEVADALVEKLFEAYHELERDISEREVLRGIAVDAGLDPVEVETLFESGAGGREVDSEEKRGRELSGGAGVPMYVIQSVHRVEGAQDASDFYEAFVQVKEAESSALEAS